MDAFKSIVSLYPPEKFLFGVLAGYVLMVDEVLDIAKLVLSLLLDSLANLSECDVSVEVLGLSALDFSFMLLSCSDAVEKSCTET
jgi:hypothetical protein